VSERDGVVPIYDHEDDTTPQEVRRQVDEVLTLLKIQAGVVRHKPRVAMTGEELRRRVAMLAQQAATIREQR